jgi:hypothetical protein
VVLSRVARDGEAAAVEVDGFEIGCVAEDGLQDRAPLASEYLTSNSRATRGR